MNRRSYLANQPDRRCRLFAGAVGIFEKFRNIFKACCRITLLSCLFLFNSNFHECLVAFSTSNHVGGPNLKLEHADFKRIRRNHLDPESPPNVATTCSKLMVLSEAA
jgi:hypothetical protein